MPPWLSILLVAVFSWLLLVLVLDSSLRLVYMAFSLTAVTPRVTWECPADAHLAILIPAHDEAQVIGNTLTTLLHNARPEQVFVLADNCGDDTAAIAAQSGVHVWERWDSEESGKGAALRWFVREAAPVLEPFSHLLILDADSEVRTAFFSALQDVVDRHDLAARCLACSPPQTVPLAVLAGFSEFLSHWVDDVARQRLGWSTPLRGRGMVFDRRLLQSLVAELRTRVEDVELSLLLAERGVHVRFVPGAVLSDAKPPHLTAATRQRARWLQGQRQVWQTYWRRIVSLLARGRADELSLVFATLIKPKTLLLLLKAVWVLAALVLPFRPEALRWGLGVAGGLTLFIDAAYYLLGLRLVDNPRACAGALATAPVYLVVWIGSLCLSWVSRAPWLKASAR